MIFGIKTKKDKKIIELEKEIEKLYKAIEINQERFDLEYGELSLKNKDLLAQVDNLNETNDHLESQLASETVINYEKVKKLEEKLDEKEKLRRKSAGALGGCKSSMNKAITEKNKIKKTLAEIEIKELHLLKVFFNEIKNDKHTKDYFRHEMKVLKEKYDKEVVINVSSNSKSFTNVECRGSNCTYKR